MRLWLETREIGARCPDQLAKVAPSNSFGNGRDIGPSGKEEMRTETSEG